MNQIASANPRAPSAATSSSGTMTLAEAMSYAQAAFNAADLESAEQLCNKILAAVPDHFDALNLLGVIMARTQREQQAVGPLTAALALRPEHPVVNNNLGNVLHELRRHDQACVCFDRALAANPDYVNARCGRGKTLLALQRAAEALADFEQAGALRPQSSEPFFLAGVALMDLGRSQAAVARFEQAIALEPGNAGAHWNYSLCLLLLGDFTAGWREYEWRWRWDKFTSPQRGFAQPLWSGQQPLAGKTLLLHAEQGLGDTLQFCRFAPALAAQGADVVLEVDKPLQSLLGTLPGVRQIIAAGDSLPEFDLHCPLLSLPLALGLTLDNLPAPEPYLTPSEGKLDQWRQRLGPASRPRVGLVWSGNSAHINDKRRSLPLAQLLRHLPPEYQYISLQKDIRVGDQRVLDSQPGVLQFTEDLRDFSDTAALCALMDLVISVDTSLVHLAGAIGQTAWVLLPDNPDWRWLLARSDSPWYPHMRLFRQASDASWDAVLSTVSAELLRTLPPPAVASATQALAYAELAYQRMAWDHADRWCQTALAADPNCSEALTLLAIMAAHSGQLQSAEQLFGQIARLDPANPYAISNHGNALNEMGHYAEAVQRYDQAILLRPDYPEALSNRASALNALARHTEALASATQAKALQPDLTSAHFNLALAHIGLGQPAAAIDCFNEVITLDPGHALAWADRGAAHLAGMNDPQRALPDLERAIALSPDLPEARLNHGIALHKLQRFDEALLSFDEAIRLRPGYAAAFCNKGVALQGLRRSTEAVSCYQRAVALSPDFAEAHANLGTALRDLGQADVAVNHHARAVALKPQEAGFHYNLGNAWMALSRLTDALASYQVAIDLDPTLPSVHWNQSLCLLQMGDYARGWALYEQRLRFLAIGLDATTHPTISGMTRWTGQGGVSGKSLLLMAEQGLGDTLQFCRFVAPVAALGLRIILAVQSPLLSLLRQVEGAHQVIGLDDALPDCDLYCPLMSLPLALGTRLDSIPVPHGYLRADAAKAALWRARLPRRARLRVGLVWSGGVNTDQPDSWAVKARRNMPLTALEALADLPCDWISLQKGQPAESELTDISGPWAQAGIRAVAQDLNDFSDTAAVLSNLDLLISVDTSTAHLAAAMGRPVWVLNRFDNCWRWLEGRRDSPWYDSVRLYRQESPGDWHSVVTQVRQDLVELLDQ